MRSGGARRKVLLLSLYFPPDLSAGSFRAYAFANALIARLPTDVDLHVISANPNRYNSIVPEAASKEVHFGGRLVIDRVAVPTHNGGFFSQSRTFLSFARGALKITQHSRYCLVLATSSRLMTAVLGATIARISGSYLYLDIRDIFADNIKYFLPPGIGKVASIFFSVFERWAIKRSSKVNLVSKGFSEYFSSKYPDVSFSFHSNGIDELFLDLVSGGAGISEHGNGGGRIKVVYAGNIGKAQGLELIIPDLALRVKDRVEIVVVGDGAGKNILESALQDKRVNNVVVKSAVPREQLVDIYRDADILFLHLCDIPPMKKVLPSKLFEYAASGKPILAGVAGYAAQFLHDNIENVAVFDPCDTQGAILALNELPLANCDRSSFIDSFRRETIMAEMAKDVVGILAGTSVC